MQLCGLEIDGFGHFRDFRIDGFSGGLTVLYGPNEAGKSTLMRFVNYVLWGLQRGEAQRFQPLRGGELGGALEFAGGGGQRLRVERRGRVLRAVFEDGAGNSSEIVDGAELERILGLDRGLFRAVFSFDLADLASLSGLGTAEARERLFSGALLGAGASVAEAQQELAARREVLWRPRAACEIRTLEEGIASVRGRLVEARRSARGVRRLHEELQELAEERARCEAEAERLLREAERFAALQAAHGVFVEQKLAEEALLAEGAGDARLEAVEAARLQEVLQGLVQTRAAQRARLEAVQQQIGGLEKAVEGVRPDEELLRFAGEIREVAGEARRLGRAYLENVRAQRAGVARRLERSLRRCFPETVLERGIGAAALPRWTEAEVDGLRRAASQAVQAAAVREKAAEAERVLARAEARLREAEASAQDLMQAVEASTGAGLSRVVVVGILLAVAVVLVVVGSLLVVSGEGIWVGSVLVGLAILVVVVVLGLGGLTRGKAGLARSREAAKKKHPKGKEGDEGWERVREEVVVRRAAWEEAGRVLGDLEVFAAGVSDADWLAAVEGTLLLAGVKAESVDVVLGAWAAAREVADELEACDAELAKAVEKVVSLQGRCGFLGEGWEKGDGESWRAFYDRIQALEGRLGEEVLRAEQLAELEKSLAHAVERRLEVEGALSVVEAQIAALLEGVGVADVEAFREAVRRASRRAALQAKIAEARRGVRTILGGWWDEETLEELARADVVGWELREAECRRQALVWQEAGRAAGESLGEKTAALRALETSGSIAQLEFELAEQEGMLEEARAAYAELLLAGNLLDGAMQTFRETHQPNVLRLASGWLAEATGGRYTGLRASEDGNDLEILGADGQVLREGALSRGTTELLYIVLRLALVRDYAQRGLRMPMIMDDVLVNLDSERAGRVAGLLERVSREQQIVMLTCRPEVCGVLGGARVVELGRGGVGWGK